MALFSGAAALIASASAWIAALPAWGAFALKMAVGIGANLLLSAIAGKPQGPTFSISTTINLGGDTPRSFIFGETITAGSLVWANTWGKEKDTDNAYLVQVIALSDIPIQYIRDLWTNGEDDPLDPTGLVTSNGDNNVIGLLAILDFKALYSTAFNALDDFLIAIGRPAIGDKLDFVIEKLKDFIEARGGTWTVNQDAGSMGQSIPRYDKKGANLWIKYYDGYQTQADGYLQNRADNAKRAWDYFRIGDGVAYAIMTARATQNMFSGYPNFKFVVRGCALYDLSKDSSRGGDGDHRIDDPETWGGDGDLNPAVQAYNLLLGITYKDKWFYGVQGMTQNRLPDENWIAAIEKCRQPVERAGGMEPRYRCSGEIQVDAPLAKALEQIMTTCSGRISEVGGFYYCFVGEPEEASFHITDLDILSTNEEQFTPFLGLADTINGVFANYPDPEDGWNMKSAPPLYRTDLETQHNNRRLMANVEMTFCPYPEQVQFLQKSNLAEAQRARRHTLTLPPKYWAYCLPCATFTWSSEDNGYETKLFRIDGVHELPNLDLIIDITEVDPEDYDWDTISDYEPPVPAATGPIISVPKPAIDFSVVADAVISDNGEQPAIRLNWDPEVSGYSGVFFEVRRKVNAEVFHTGTFDEITLGMGKITQGVHSETEYEVRARYRSISEQEDEWSSWMFVKTLNNPLTDISVTFAKLSAEIKQDLARLNDQTEILQDKLRQLAGSTLDGTTQATHSNGLAVRRGNAFAALLQEANLAILDTNGVVNAHAAYLTALQATVGNLSSGVFWRMEAIAGGGDVVARYDLQVRADVGDSFVSSGLILEAGYVGGDPGEPFSRIKFIATDVVIADGLGVVKALFNSDGASFDNTFIKELTVDNIMARSIYGDRIVVAGIDTPELQIDSVTYVDEDSSTSNVNASPTGTLMATCAVIGYVSGGVTGAGTVAFTPSAFASSIQHIVRVVRSASPSMTSPVEVGRNMYGVYSVRDAGGATSISVAVADVPPSAGDWYYGLYFGADLITVSTSRKLVLVHGKR